MSIGLQPNQIDSQQQELSNSVEKLISKLNDLTLSNKFLEQNKMVSKFITKRGDGGLIMTMQELICQAIDNHQVMRQINEDQVTNCFHMAESILARVTSLPVQNYNNLANGVIIKLVNNTPAEYHKLLIKSMFQMMATLFEEKKRGKQEGFKNKILYKLSYMISLILYKTTDVGKIDIFQKIGDLFRTGTKNEMIYILFQAIDGAQMKQNSGKFGFQKTVCMVIGLIQEKLEVHIRDNKERIEKSSSIKNLVLLFKPLEECLRIVGPLNELLPEGYRKRIHSNLNQLRKMFPMQGPPDCQVPYSLLESFYHINLIIDVQYIKTGKISFANFYKLYTIVENQLDKNEQNALIMAKLIILQTKTDVPHGDKDHFYAQFGKTCQKMLNIKEFYIFFKILTSFIEWASHTELQDLNFMVPNNADVQNCLQSIMGQNKITNIASYDYQQKMRYLNDNHYHQASKDQDVIQKFCQVKETKASNSTNDNSQSDSKEARIDILGGAVGGSSTTANSATISPVADKVAPPALPVINLVDNDSAQVDTILAQITETDNKLLGIAQKLIDVELMMRDEEDENPFSPQQIKKIAQDLLKQFKQINPASVGSIKEFKIFVNKSKHLF